MPSITLLPDHVINQIAAGEVIENPSSVVKELVENSIDAGATKIHVEILAGGFQQILIEDNGLGMNREDAILSIQRHATSKITSLDDLMSLSTKGFRGEALASVASIAKMKLTTSDGQTAAVVKIEGGNIIDISPSARERGTTIEVCSLFYNVPARKKFQKTVGASVAAITKVLTHLSLSHPECCFSLTAQNSLIFSSNVHDLPQDKMVLARIKDLLGKEIANDLIPIFYQDGAISISGYIGKPNLAKSNRSLQYLFVNRRSVFSLLIGRAVIEGYGTRISSDMFPAFILYVDLPGELVDVNVHPQKKEVRFRQESFLKDLVSKAISLALQTQTPTVLKEQSVSFASTLAFQKNDGYSWKEELFSESFYQPPLFTEQKKPIKELALYSPYLIVDGESLGVKNGFAMIDLNRAFFRVSFDNLMKAFQGSLLESEMLSIPCIVNVSKEQAVEIESNLSFFSDLGLELRFISENSIAIDTILSFMQIDELANLFFLLLEEISSFAKADLIEKEKEKKLAHYFGKIYKGRKKTYTSMEALHILEKLLQSTDWEVDPLGNLIVKACSIEEIKQWMIS